MLRCTEGAVEFTLGRNPTMGRKRFNHYADVVCRMFMGWRMQEDLEALAQLPDGSITVDLLAGTASHSSAGAIPLHIAKEIQAWLAHESQKDGIKLSPVEDAKLFVAVKTDTVKTNRKKIVCFSFDCRSEFRLLDRTYVANVSETHRWHERIAP